MNDEEVLLHRTIATISQSDPLIKLLEQVRLGRMNRADPGLRVIIGSWLATYRKAIGSSGLTKHALRRLDPSPRLELLRQEGMLPADDAEAGALIDEYRQVIGRAPV